MSIVVQYGQEFDAGPRACVWVNHAGVEVSQIYGGINKIRVW